MATLHSFAVTGPYGQACPPDQRRVVFRPVRDPVFDLGDLVAPLHLATHSANNRVTASTTYGLFVHQRGLWRSLKYECVYLHAFETGSELRTGLAWWIGYYNTRRPHSGLEGRTPDEAYAAIGTGADDGTRLAA
jgi:putative transposase